MIRFCRRLLKAIFRRPLVAFAARSPNPFTLELMRRISGIQLTRREIGEIVRTVREKPSTKFLVFGLGNDSLFWQSVNRGGHTAFIEDDVKWLEMVRLRDGLRHVTTASYNTQLKDWPLFLEGGAAFDLQLSDEIVQGEWDVILVDGPAAWCETVPGRMKSIAISTRLITDGGHIFIHDFDRKPEHDLAYHFIGQQHCRSVVDKLAHFVAVRGVSY
jgi:hypothetical protein